MIRYYKSNICTAAVRSEFPYYLRIPAVSGKSKKCCCFRIIEAFGEFTQIKIRQVNFWYRREDLDVCPYISGA